MRYLNPSPDIANVYYHNQMFNNLSYIQKFEYM